MSINYNLNIPDGPNDPSADQPLMKENTNSIDTWTNVDHIKFAAGAGNTAGTHKQVTFNNKNAAGAVTDPTSILYTGDGTASAKAEVFFRNEEATLLISGIKAFGRVIPNTGVLSNALNCTVSSFGATVVIALTAGVTTGNNVCIFTSQAAALGPTYTFSSPNLTLTPVDATQPISFIIIQI